MAVRQRDIAENLGISVGLVSRVLSGKAAEIGVAQRTIERVQKNAAELGYIPNAAALSLKGKATQTIGVVVMDFTDPYFGKIVGQLQSRAYEHGYSLVLAGNEDFDSPNGKLNPLQKHAIDGLIILGSKENLTWLKTFKKIPIARIGHGCTGKNSVQVTPDEADAVTQLLDHLIAKGHRAPVFVGKEHQFVHQMRLKYLTEAAEQRGIKMQSIMLGKEVKNTGCASAQIIKELKTADAMICATDTIAMGALHGLHEAGISVPNQMAVTGIDDIPGAEHYIPALTTFRLPTDKMVETAFAAMLNPMKPQSITITGELIIRKST